VLRLACILAVLAVALTACGQGPNAQDVLSQTAANLDEIRSGDLSLRLIVAARGGEQAGFELAGPVALAKEGALPVAEIEYTQIAGDERAAVAFISTGERAYVEIGETVYALRPGQVDELRGGGAATGGLGELRIEDWFVEPELSGGGEVGGTETDRIAADVDVVAAANDLIQLARELGAANVDRIEGESATQLRRSVESATIEVYTGEEDRLLRRLAIDARLRADVPREVEEALGTFGGARFTLELGIADPNRPVSVEAPENARPYPGDQGA
jgi:hypothetical protein